MPEQVIWTALPNGTRGEGGALRLALSVLASPRLGTPDGANGTLDQFVDFVNWPQTMAATTFDVAVDGAVVAEGLAPLHHPEPELWTALFKPDTLVRSYRFKDDLGQAISYPVRTLHEGLESLYGDMALDGRNGLPFGFRRGPSQKGTLADLLADSAFHPPPGDPEFREPISLFRRFYDRPSRPDAALPTSSEARRDLLDFHQAVGCLGDYPEILRLFGLVFDLEVPFDAIGPSVGGASLRVLPRWEPADPSSPTPDRSPSTSTTWDGTVFAARSAGLVDRGQVVLDGARHDIVQVDLDGAVRKLLNLTLDLAHAQTMNGADNPRPSGLPALRSAGFSLAESDRGATLQQRLDRMKTNNDLVEGPRPEDAVFVAEQLVRGFSIDVWDSRSGAWRSLCRRIGTYTFTDGGLTRHLEGEGFVQLSAAGVPRPPGAPSEGMYVHESLLRWDGWSLAVPRPGKSLDHRGDPRFGPTAPTNEPVTPFKMKPSFTPPPRSLPRLRFGVGYRFRARVVDVAGNSVHLEDVGDEHALPSTEPGRVYFRFDPVPAPNLVLRRALTRADAGESLERLVVRSANREVSLDAVPTVEISERHVAPPRTTVDMAEAHGAFDDATGRLRGDPPTRDMIAAREEAQFPQEGDTAVEPGDQLAVPYLPDVLARGAAMRNLPGARRGTVGSPDAAGDLRYETPPVISRHDSVTQIDFGPPARWPAMLPFRMVLAEGDKPPVWDAHRRVLTVQLPKAGSAVVPLSSYLDRGDLDLMGIWEWLRTVVDERAAALHDPQSLEDLTIAVAEASQRAIEGGHWMLTPARELHLVHAVQQPLGRPVVEDLTTERNLGSTQFSLLGSLGVDGRSTAKVDLLASWAEFRDSEPNPATPVTAEEHLAELALRSLGSDIGVADIRFGGHVVGSYHPSGTVTMTPDMHPHHDFGDTKHRALRCRAVATSRFAEYFRRNRTVTLSGTTPVVLEPEGMSPGSDVVRSTDGDTVYSRFDGKTGDYGVDYRAGTLFRCDDSRIGDGTTVVAEFLPPVSRDSESPLTVHVPSSARPAPPKLLYVVPLFEWKRQTRTNMLASERLGGWLRIYLDRPWHSSGEGELLGVVTAATDDPSPDLLPFVTCIGNDPVRAPSDAPELSFPNAAVADFGPDMKGLTLGELTAADEHRVHVHAHEVHFDPVRGLWFSDVRVGDGLGPFEPFVRLSLARYQPHSVERFDTEQDAPVDVKTSQVVPADFAQLPSGRSVLVTYDPSRPRMLRVVVCGQTFEDTARANGPSVVSVGVDERRPGIEGDLAWRGAPGVSVVRDAAPTGAEPDVALWRGVVTLPEDRSIDEFRLTVRELDKVPGDRIVDPERLLYADALELESLAPSRASTTTSLTSSANPSAFGQSVTFTARVNAERPGSLGGRITFLDGIEELATVALQDGVASTATSELPAGSHQIVARYQGDDTFAPSSAAIVQQVERAGTTVDVIPRLEIHGETPF